jgi:hypothetical protein
VYLNTVDKNEIHINSTFWYLDTDKKLIQASWPDTGVFSPRIIKQFELPRLKGRHWEHKKLEGYIHSYGTRCTLLVRDENWYTF